MLENIKNIFVPIVPIDFDKNELYAIFISILICYAIYFVYKQKILMLTESMCIFFFNLYLAILGDYSLALPPYDLYDTFDRPTWELADIPIHFIVYPGSILFLMHWFKKTRTRALPFILICTLILTGLEAVSIYLFNIIQYKKWKLGYSFLFYFVVMIVNVLLYKKLAVFIEKTNAKL